MIFDVLPYHTPNVSRQSLKVLTRNSSLLSAARVWQLFTATPHAHVKRNALSLLARFPKWESISYLVSVLCDADEDIVQMSRVAIRRWLNHFNRSFSSPTVEQVAKLKTALENCGKLVDEKTLDQLRFALKGF